MPINDQILLRRFSKLLCFSTLVLIFIGGLVKSTGSGLAVPDWPLSYGSLFPPMVGGVLYEHGHRMAASVVGFITLVFAFLLQFKEKRSWVRKLGWTALGLVIAQGLLGGLTVLLFLPDSVSIMHGVLAQTFFMVTIILAYSQSIERSQRAITENKTSGDLLRLSICFIIMIYFQLILGALVRHTESGLAIPDFPTVGGHWLPAFDQNMLANINARRFELNLDPITMSQVVIHFVHRAWAFLIVIMLLILNKEGLKEAANNYRIKRTIHYLDLLIVLQVLFGAGLVLSHKEVFVTTFHVVTGAAILGMSLLLFLRLTPINLNDTKKQLFYE